MKKWLEKALIVIGGVLLFYVFLCGLCAAEAFRKGRRYIKSILMVASAASLAGYAAFLVRTGGSCDVYGFGSLGCLAIMAVLLAIWGGIAKWFWKRHADIATQMAQKNAEEDASKEEVSASARIGIVAIQILAAFGIIAFTGGMFIVPFGLGSEGLLSCVSLCITFFMALAVAAVIWPLVVLLFWGLFFRKDDYYHAFGKFFGAATARPMIMAEGE